MKDKLLQEITRRLKPQPVKIAADFEITCFSKEGIYAIKEALCEGEKLSTPETPISINLVSSPLFTISATVLIAKKKANEFLEDSLNAIKKTIEGKGGSFRVKKSVYFVGKNQDKEMEDKLFDMEKENANKEDLQFEEETD